MAVIFSSTQNGVHYEVRSAGRSRRLYTNEAFHSQHNPGFLFTGAVWDLLALPSLCLPESPGKVLALGVGGGTVIHQLDQLHPIQALTGVELDPVHIEIARKYFDVNFEHTTLVEADARTWLKRSKARFDYIVDDVFLHGEVDPARPFYPDDEWCALLRSHTTSGGGVVQNHINDTNARKGYDTFKRQFAQVLTFSNAMYGNTVIAGFATPSSTAALKKRCADVLEQLPRRETSRLRHRISGRLPSA